MVQERKYRSRWWKGVAESTILHVRRHIGSQRVALTSAWARDTSHGHGPTTPHDKRSSTHNLPSDAYGTHTATTQEAPSAPRCGAGVGVWTAQIPPTTFVQGNHNSAQANSHQDGDEWPQGPRPSVVTNSRNYFNPHMELLVTPLHHLLHSKP